MYKTRRYLSLLGLALLLSACANKPTDQEYADFAPMHAVAENGFAQDCEDEVCPEDSQLIEPTLKVNDDLWQRIRDGFRMNLDNEHPRVVAERDWILRHPQYLQRVTSRAKRYLYYIVEQAEAADVPLEMTLLPIVESAFDPFAYSHGRAAGAWQFIPSTGRAFGMHQDYWYDGRRDILQSTESALKYLTQLAKRFDDDWELALASYNAGGGTVSRAITRNRGRNQPTDFWHLELPRETRAYVPKLIALSQIVLEPEKYGVTTLEPISNQPYFTIVNTEGQIDLKLAADLAQVPVEEIYLLNPGFSQWATPPQGPHRLLIPLDNAPLLETALLELPPEKRLQWITYTIARGDTLDAIARRHRTSISQLKEVNKLRNNTIVAGRTLLIPQPGAAPADYALSATQRDTARQQQLSSNGQTVHYQVKAGDTLWDISRKMNVGVRELARWNGMAPGDPLTIGKRLIVKTNNAAPAVASSDRPEMLRRIRYTVRRGDSLHAIANRFNVSVREINAWNNLSSSRYIHPGQQITLHVDVRKAP